MGTVQKNSRTFKLRRDAEKHSHRFVKLKSVEWRVQIAFQAGADWERRRWLKLGRVERPESYVGPIKVGMRVTGKSILLGTRIPGAARGPTRREIDMVHFIPPRR